MKTFSLNAALEISRSEPTGDYLGVMMGRFELIIGEEEEGSPVYRQADSREIPGHRNYLLFR